MAGDVAVTLSINEEEREMKRSLLMTIAAVSLLTSTPSFAQTTVIELSPDQRTTIRDTW